MAQTGTTKKYKEQQIQAHKQQKDAFRCTHKDVNMYTSSYQTPLCLENRLIKSMTGHPPPKTLGNRTPKVFYFDEVLHYQINKVRRKHNCDEIPLRKWTASGQGLAHFFVMAKT